MIPCRDQWFLNLLQISCLEIAELYVRQRQTSIMELFLAVNYFCKKAPR